jgi:hypothetical protein
MHDKIADEFGKDLELILGPKNRRIPITALSKQEIQDRINSVVEFIPQQGTKSIVDVSIAVLKAFQNSHAFDGIDIPIIDKLPDWGTKEYSIDDCYLDYDAQRGTHARHIAGIIFKFEAEQVTPGIGRKNGQEVFINDGQHRFITAICLGVTFLPISVREDSSQRVDFDQYVAMNCDNLPSEPYDNFRNRVSRAEYYAEQNIEIPYTDQEDYAISLIMKSHGCVPVSKKDDKGQDQPGAIHRFDQVYRFYRNFGKSIFNKSLGLLRTTWHDQPAISSAHWGLCWLFKFNPEISKGDQNLISRALRERWKKAGRLWIETNKRVENTFGEDSWQDNADNGLKIASAMYSAIKKQFDDVEIVQPKDSKGRTIDVDIPIMS